MHGVNHLARRPTGRLFHCKLHTILTLLQKKYNISRTLHLLVQFVSYIVLRIFKDYYIYG